MVGPLARAGLSATVFLVTQNLWLTLATQVGVIHLAGERHSAGRRTREGMA